MTKRTAKTVLIIAAAILITMIIFIVMNGDGWVFILPIGAIAFVFVMNWVLEALDIVFARHDRK